MKKKKKDLESQIVDILNKHDSKKRVNGLRISKYCDCGKYQPKSTSGLKNYDCRNCGGKKKPVFYKSVFGR